MKALDETDKLLEAINRQLHPPLASSSGSPAMLGTAAVRAVEVNIGIKENRWKLLKALLLYPKATHIRMTIPAASVFISPLSQENGGTQL